MAATSVPAPTGQDTPWRDRKRYLWLVGLVVPSLAFVAFTGFALTRWTAWLWIGPILILVIVPLLDLLVGLDPSNPPDELVETLEKDRYYRRVVIAYLPIQYLGLAAAMYLVVRGNPAPAVLDLLGPLGGWARGWLRASMVEPFTLTLAQKVAASVSVGCIGGIGINTAHELGHKREQTERWLSKVALAQSCYGHFYIEHNRGHHVRVSTPEDPASSRLGESFYAFWPRTVLGSLRSAWALERRRYARRHQHPFRPGNEVLNAWAMSLVLVVALVAWLGVGVLPYVFLQALVGLSLLEVVNYLEHYGMLRQRVMHGDRSRYERVLPRHSWNSNNIATNVLLYHLQRHSDHHANPTRRYQCLRDFEESPALPTGYAGMIVLALLPPLWRRVMDPRVVAHHDGDVRLANIAPGKEARYLAAYPSPADDGPRAGEDIVVRAGDEVSVAQCPGCGYRYEVERGDEHEGFAAGTPWSLVPDDWTCPDCGVRDKVDFRVVETV